MQTASLFMRDGESGPVVAAVAESSDRSRDRIETLQGQVQALGDHIACAPWVQVQLHRLGFAAAGGHAHLDGRVALPHALHALWASRVFDHAHEVTVACVSGTEADLPRSARASRTQPGGGQEGIPVTNSILRHPGPRCPRLCPSRRGPRPTSQSGRDHRCRQPRTWRSVLPVVAERAAMKSPQQSHRRMTTGSRRQVQRLGDRGGQGGPAGVRGPLAEVGVFPIQEEPLVETATWSNASRRISVNAPLTQSTGTMPPSGAALKFLRLSGLSGATRDNQDVLPPSAVVRSGNRRAECCKAPSPSRISPPTSPLWDARPVRPSAAPRPAPRSGNRD